MSKNINVTLPDNIAKYLHLKSRLEYLPMSAVARKYIAKSVVEEMVVTYYQQGFSIHRLAELADVPVARVMDILRRTNTDEHLDDLDADLDQIESEM